MGTGQLSGPSARQCPPSPAVSLQLLVSIVDPASRGACAAAGPSSPWGQHRAPHTDGALMPEAISSPDSTLSSLRERLVAVRATIFLLVRVESWKNRIKT
jgi:hypothetical protein